MMKANDTDRRTKGFACRTRHVVCDSGYKADMILLNGRSDWNEDIIPSDKRMDATSSRRILSCAGTTCLLMTRYAKKSYEWNAT